MSFVFYLFAAIVIVGALGVVHSRNIVHSALFLVLSFIGVALLYFSMGAEFLGAVQLMVYSGAVAVLIVMAIMLTRRDSMENSNPVQGVRRRVLSGLLGGSIFFLIGIAIAAMRLPEVSDEMTGAPTGAKEIAEAMFGNFVLPFEVAAVLLLIAMIGALVLARGGDTA